MVRDTNRVCPVTHARALDNRLRRWFQNPRKILAPYLTEGMTALDLGCGPGFFTLEMARLVGPGGRVIAADLQAGMLAKLKPKLQAAGLAGRVRLHHCGARLIGLTAPIDFALAFYVVHEVPDADALFEELAACMAAGGRGVLVEPAMHVSRAAFEKTLAAAGRAGFHHAPGPRVRLSRSALLTRGGPIPKESV